MHLLACACADLDIMRVQSFKVLNEQPSKAEKRPRAVKTQTSAITGRRAALGDVTNRINVRTTVCRFLHSLRKR